jgi:hypothetical protein
MRFFKKGVWGLAAAAVAGLLATGDVRSHAEESGVKDSPVANSEASFSARFQPADAKSPADAGVAAQPSKTVTPPPAPKSGPSVESKISDADAADPKPAKASPSAPQSKGKRSENPGATTTPAKSPAASSDRTRSRPPVTTENEPLSRKPADRLSADMTELRDRVRKTLAVHFHQPINTVENTPGEILQFCLAYGCDTEVRFGGPAGNAINGVGCLCYNYACSGYELLTVSKRMAVARVGYGLQEQPGQLLSVLAQSAVPIDYEIKIGKGTGTVADIVEYEKATCLSGGDLSRKLIGLSFYLGPDDRWKNAGGEEWTIERMVKEELTRLPVKGDADITEQLYGLSWALRCRERSHAALDGQYRRAERYINAFHDYALSLENADGSWHPMFFAAKGTGNDPAGLLRASGRIVEWLAFSLPEDRLDDPRMVKAVSYLTGLLENYHAKWNATNSTPREIGDVMHGLHALRVYDRRLFRAYDPPKSTPESEKAAQTPNAGQP